MKELVRFLYKFFISTRVYLGLVLFKRKPSKVCFCGALKGSQGGPLVKSNLLIDEFGQSYQGFEILYTFSGMPHVSPKILEIAKMKNIPIVHNQNGVFYEGWYGHGWQARNREMATIYQMADLVLFQSEFCANSSIEFLGQANGAQQILYNAVDTKLFIPKAASDSRKPFTFLIAGKIGDRFDRLRGAVVGLNYARKSGLDCQLVIAGPVSKNVQGKINTLSFRLNLTENIKFLGPYNRTAAPIIFREADAFISLNYNDSCPNSVLEALSSGLPVIYSDSGGTPELVLDQCGIPLSCEKSWEVQCFPDDGLVGPAMVTVSENIGNMSYMSRKLAVDKFDLQMWLEKHEQIFTRLTQGNKF